MSRRAARLRALADELGAYIKFDTAPISPYEARSDPSPYRGWTTPPAEAGLWPLVRLEAWDDSNCAYFIGLHELGHVARGHAVSYAHAMSYYWGNDGRNIVPLEAEAWEWALEHMDEPIEPETAENAARWLGGYYRNRGGADARYFRVMDTLRAHARQSRTEALLTA